MIKQHKSLLLFCTAFLLMLVFSMGVAAQERPGNANVKESVVSTSDIADEFYFFESVLTLPESGKVIYGTVADTVGTEASLTDTAFTSLSPGTDYTWWLYYDDAQEEYCLFFDHFVMTTPFDAGYIVNYHGAEAFQIKITASTLLGNQRECAIIYTAAAQTLSIDDSTLIQNSDYGHISGADGDLTVTVNDSVLTCMNDDQTGGGDVFIVNYDSDENACALTATFSGENTVTGYYDLLYSFEGSSDSSATLIVEDDLSYTGAHDFAVHSDGDVTIDVAEGAELTLGAENGDYAIKAYGDVAISGGGTIDLHGGYGGIYAYGDVAISGGGMANLYGEDAGIYAYGDVAISGGGMANLYGEDAGIYADGDVAISGGGTVDLHGGNHGIYTEGTIDVSDCSLIATGDGPTGALWAGEGIETNDLYLYPTAAAATEMTVTYYFVYFDEESEEYSLYLKLESADGEVFYYDGETNTPMTESDFEAAIDSSETESDTDETVLMFDGEAFVHTVYLLPDTSQGYTDQGAWASWAKPYIAFAVNYGVMGSNSSTSLRFDADIAINRGMMVQILYNAIGQPAVTAEDIKAYNNKFSDVATNAWYYKAVVWASNEGIAKGTTGNQFSPLASVTREQVVTFLWRFAGSTEVDFSLSSFADAGTVSDYAKDAFAWAAEAGFINGIASGDKMLLSPKTGCTRAQMAAILTRYITENEYKG
ncbi:MAG TPA: S-layer homology domain-containing protein [Clostridiales bacterium]|nr:S-layer homology domain-containing protein [Clostridiales bacterium]